jgi:TonB-linked SusC/RagA family outer membrane protein
MSKSVLFLTMLFCLFATAYAQQEKTISGTVSDGNSGELLMGALVTEAGATNGMITDMDGHFTLKLKGDKIIVSYVGYNPQEIKVESSGIIQVKLISNLSLDEVVVVGYGTQRKSDLTGSVSSITGKELKNYAVSNVSELLAGKAAGVFAAAPSGQPGESAVVRIRGFGTVNDNNPLYVVDGQFMNSIVSLNPADIGRIEILKDASAAAIYGSRGSNGVILVTTKQGVKGETTITLDAYVGMKNSYKAQNMMNSEQFYNYITEAYKEDQNFQHSMKEKFTNQYRKGYNTDWWDEVTRNAFNQNYNLGIRKGSETSRSNLSIGYLDDQGAIITTEFKRSSLRFSQEYDINNYVTTGASLSLAKSRYRNSGVLPSFGFIQTADPFTPVISPLVDPSSENYEYNKYAPTEWSFNPNPVSMLELPDRYNDEFNAFGNIFALLKLADGLTYRAQYSFERNHNMFKDFRPLYSATFSEDNLANRESKYATETKLTNNSTLVFNYVMEQRINYNKAIKRHRFDFMLAMTYEKNLAESINAYKTNALGNDEIYQVLDAQTIGAQASGGKQGSSMLSYLGRLNYSYADTYLLTATFRADASSRFAEEHRWGYFPLLLFGLEDIAGRFLSRFEYRRLVVRHENTSGLGTKRQSTD